MKLFVIAVFVVALLTVPLMAQDNIDGFEARLYKSESGDMMPYRLFIPPRYDKHKKYPLILWLHGAGGIGIDNVRQIAEDQIPGTRLWTTTENQTRHPAFVLVPQSRSGWAAFSDKELAPPLTMVLEIIKAVRGEFRIDPQ